MSITDIISIISGIVLPILSSILGFFINAYRKSKKAQKVVETYNEKIREWGNKTSGSINSIKEILESDSLKMEPPLKDEMCKIINNILAKEYEITRDYDNNKE